jgi:hypothetical protein
LPIDDKGGKHEEKVQSLHVLYSFTGYYPFFIRRKKVLSQREIALLNCVLSCHYSSPDFMLMRELPMGFIVLLG